LLVLHNKELGGSRSRDADPLIRSRTDRP